MADITAASIPITLGRKTFNISPLDDVDIEELNNWLRASIIRMAQASLSDEMTQKERDEVLDRAIANARQISWISGAGAETMGTLDGITRVIWQGIKKLHPDVSYQEIRKLVTDPATVEMALKTFKELNLGEEGDRPEEGSPKAPRRPPLHRRRPPKHGSTST